MPDRARAMTTSRVIVIIKPVVTSDGVARIMRMVGTLQDFSEAEKARRGCRGGTPPAHAARGGGGGGGGVWPEALKASQSIQCFF